MPAIRQGTSSTGGVKQIHATHLRPEGGARGLASRGEHTQRGVSRFPRSHGRAYLTAGPQTAVIGGPPFSLEPPSARSRRCGTTHAGADLSSARWHGEL